MTGVRDAIADAVRTRVVGPGGPNRATEIFSATGPRWFGPDRPIRRVHGDASMFTGGLRALLLQSLHPLAMAGVAQHSDYKRDPWGRLQRTADFLATTTYGPIDQAEEACRRVVAVHRRVRGRASDGRPYSANDPHLMRWVHLVEVDSFLAAYRRFGAESLTPSEADAYVADMAVMAGALGIPDAPVSVRELRDQLAGYRCELRATREARDSARFLLFPSGVPLAARGPYGLLTAAAVSLLPWWARRELRLLPVLPVTERAVVQPAGRALTGVLRWALDPGSPEPVTS